MKTLIRFIAASMLLMLACGSMKAGEREESVAAPSVNAAELMLLLEQQRYVPYNSDAQIDRFFKYHRKDFRAMDLRQILDELSVMTPGQQDIVLDGIYLNPTLMTLLSAFLGEFGVDRFLLGDIGLGALKLATGGGLGIWWLIDIFTTPNRTKDRNYEEYCDLANYAQIMRR